MPGWEESVGRDWVGMRHDGGMSHHPQGMQLDGGNSGAVILRIGDTVRRPAGFWSASVDALLRHLNAVGYRGAPRTLGFDDLGRHVLEYVEGDVVMPFVPRDPVTAARRVGELIRDFHDASADFRAHPEAQWNVAISPGREDLIIHHDLGPWNMVLGTTRWVFIDWDGAGPGSRLWDLAYAAHGFIPLTGQTSVTDAALRLGALVDGYRLDDRGRSELADLLVPRIMSMYDLLHQGHQSGAEPWAKLWAEGHGRVWLANAEYAQRHRDALRTALTHSA